MTVKALLIKVVDINKHTHKRKMIRDHFYRKKQIKTDIYNVKYNSYFYSLPLSSVIIPRLTNSFSTSQPPT